MIILLAGSAAGIAALGVVVYRAIPNRTATPAAKVEPENNNQSSPPISAPKSISSETEAVSEAPPPFADDPGLSATKRISTPTDTTAIGISSPFLTIQVPKTIQQRGAVKTKRKRRTAKVRSFPQNLGATRINPIDPPGKKEPSAA